MPVLTSDLGQEDKTSALGEQQYIVIEKQYTNKDGKIPGNMTTKEIKTFDSVAFFRAIKEKMAKMMEGMTLAEKKEFMQKIRDGKIKPV